MSEDKALNYLRSRINRCERESPSGYKVFSDDTPYVINLKPITYKILHFILNSVLYFLSLAIYCL
jgi:hypothetical protein